MSVCTIIGEQRVNCDVHEKVCHVTRNLSSGTLISQKLQILTPILKDILWAETMEE